jgi:hypothetical protein
LIAKELQRGAQRIPIVVIYFAIVAIGNVIIGVFLARFIWFPTNVSFAAALAPAGARTAREAAPPASTRSSVIQQSSQIAGKSDTSQSEPSDVLESAEQEVKVKSQKERAGYAKSWSDFAQQLREIKSRVNYCRTAQDMHLLRQAAEQLKSCAQVWHEQLGKCIGGEELDEATKALVDGMDLAAIEMFAAQCETSISNIEALDYSAPVAEVLFALEREIEMLDSQQKNVDSSKKRRPSRSQ